MPGYRIIAGEIIEELTVDDFAECFANCLLKKTTARGSGCGAWNFDPENKKCSLLRPTPSCCSPLENRRQSSSTLSGYLCPNSCFLSCPPERVCEVDSISNETFCYDLPPENDFACTTYRVPPIVNNPTAVITTIQSKVRFSRKCVWKYRRNRGWRCVPSRPCLTVGGPFPDQAGKKCIFPFTWKGVTYNGCPVDPQESTERWCSTKVDSAGNHVTGEKEFGYCASNCPKHD